MRNSYKRKRTLKTKIPPALSHGVLRDQQKKKIDMVRKMNCKRTKRDIKKSHNGNVENLKYKQNEIDFQVKHFRESSFSVIKPKENGKYTEYI